MVLNYTSKSPKNYRFTFSTRLQNLAVDAFENLHEANNTRIQVAENNSTSRRNLQEKAVAKINKLLGALTDVAEVQGAITGTQAENIFKRCSNLTNLVFSWMKSDTRRVSDE